MTIRILKERGYLMRLSTQKDVGQHPHDNQASNKSCLLNWIACLSAFFTQSLRMQVVVNREKGRKTNWLEKTIEL